jgi:AraC-like DNA-binding protein
MRGERAGTAQAVPEQGNNSARTSIEFRPAEGALLPLVESYYVYRYDAAQGDGIDRVDIGQIRFVLKGAGTRTFPDGHVENGRAVMINGPGTAAATYRMEGPFHCFGISLRAIGWKALVGLPSHKVSNRIIPGEEVFGPEVLALLDRLRGLDGIDAMIAEVEPFLLARRKPVPRAPYALVRALREWAATDAPVIEGFYARLPMSERQVTRLCNEYFGGPPKFLERKYRAIRAAMRIFQGESTADVAERFSDQSHMINEIKHFTGHTPTSLRESIDPVLAATLANETFHFLPEVFPESVDEPVA